jgi:serine/threonine protein kinase
MNLYTEDSAMQEAVDVWSLGVMAFELLTGKPALCMFEGKKKVHNLSLLNLVSIYFISCTFVTPETGTCAGDGLH